MMMMKVIIIIIIIVITTFTVVMTLNLEWRNYVHFKSVLISNQHY